MDVGYEKGNSHTTGRVDTNSKTVDLGAQDTRPRDMWAQVTVGEASIPVELGPMVVSRPK